MQNQRLPKVAMAKTAIKRSRFNFSHDVNTTADFGVVQPSTCKYIVGNSKTTLSTESLTRLAPMVAPTFGRMKLKHWHYFVECSDVCEQWKSFLAREPIYSPIIGSTYVPRDLPTAFLSSLSALCFVGARVTFYKCTDLSGLYDYKFVPFKQNSASDMTELENVIQSWKTTNDSNALASPVCDQQSDSFSSVSGNHIVLCLSPYIYAGNSYRSCIGRSPFKKASSWLNALGAPLANEYEPITGVKYADLGHIVDTNGNLINHPVTIEGADYLWHIQCNDNGTIRKYTLAFRFSDAGKRWRKIMIGLGYQVDLTNTERVNILPFLAYYRAYWSLFQLPQWKAWEETNCYKLIHFLSSNFNSISDITDPSYPYNRSDFFTYFVGFYKDCVDCYVTDSADFVSSHIPGTAISPKVDLGFIDVTSNDAIVDVDSSSPNFGTNGHSYINLLQHGHLDEEYLKTIYKWTNRNTIIGRRVAELLRAQGLGSFVDSTKSSFVGYTEDVINISDVVSQADTSFAGAQGAQLGQFGGKGVQYTKGKNFIYENDEPGFFITLSAIVPESGYSQAIDSCHYAYRKEDIYHPDFDSMGYDMSRKTIITGATDNNDNSGSLQGSFGFKPRYFEYKFKNNVCNGDFTLRSTRDVYLPYFLDKFIPVDDYHFASDINGDLMAKKVFGSNQIPTAGNWWRFITKYPWLGNLKRIFADYGHVDDNGAFIPFINDFDLAYWTTSNHDDFLIHSIFDMQCYAPMLAVEDSFETTDDDEKSNMSVSKA